MTQRSSKDSANPADGPVPTYSLAERDRRWALARELMAEKGLACLVVYGDREGTGPAPFAFDTYFTNDRPGSLVVFPRRGDPVALLPLPMYASDHFEAAQRGDSLWLRPESLRFPRSPQALVATIREFGAEKGAIGIVGSEPYPPFYFVPPFPAAFRGPLAQALPEATLVPVGHDLARRMMVQSEEELAVVRHAAAVGDVMAEAMRAAARPGVRESEVYAAGMDAAHRRGVVAPGMILTSGPQSVAWGPPAWAYRPQEPRRLEAGDVLLAEVFVQCGMKETQHQVALALGAVHEDFERAARLARTAYDAGLDALRPGRKFGEVADAMRRPIEEAGGTFVHPVVHGLNPFGTVSGVRLGLGAQPGAETYRLRAEIPTVLGDLEVVAGMTFAFEPNCALGRRVVNLGGTVLVGEDAPEELNPLTARLLRVDA